MLTTPVNETKVTGRKKTTGKYDTREELIEKVIGFKTQRGLSDTSIARICQVSAGTVANILNEYSRQFQ